VSSQEGNRPISAEETGGSAPPKTPPGSSYSPGSVGIKNQITPTNNYTPTFPNSSGTTVGDRFPHITNKTAHTATDNTCTNNADNNTDRPHHSNTHGHTRPYAVHIHGYAKRPGSDPETAQRPAVKGREGPNQGPGRGRIEPGLGLDPGSGARVSQNNTPDKTKTHKTTHPSESKGQLGRDLNIISWNIRGFHCNKNSLIAAIQDKQPDIVLLQETLTNTKYSIKIPGYTIYHSPHTKNSDTVSRGLITAIHNNIPHNTSPLINSSSDWQSITTEITGFKSGPFQLINTYVSPNHLYDIQQATNSYKHYLITGDLNANTTTWGSKNTRPGQHLQQQISDCDAILLNDPKVPTTLYGSTLDLAIASPEVAAIADWSQLEALTSDHIATVIVLSDAFTNVPESLGQPKWDTDKANWKQFADRLHELSADDSDNSLSLDDLLRKLTDDINEAATAAIPIVLRNRPRRPRSFLTPEARRWTKEVSKLTKVFKAHPTSQNRAELRAAQRETRRRLHTIKEDQFDSWCKQLGDMGSAQIWREIKKIRGKSSQPKVINPKEEANRLAHHFATRADHQTLPEEVKSALEKQQPDRLHSIHLAKVNTQTQTPLSHHTNWKQFYQHQKTPPLEKTNLHTSFTPNLPLLSKLDF
jgi:hypothetical protein